MKLWQLHYTALATHPGSTIKAKLNCVDMDRGNYKDVSTIHPQTDNTAKQNIGVVATCISEEISLIAAQWTLFNLLSAGDLLILLAICNDTGDTNRTAEQVEKTTAVLESSCRERKVFFELRSKSGDVKSVILEEVNAVHASLVTLDRNLKLKQGEDMKVIQENLTCRIFMMPDSDDINLTRKPVDAEMIYSLDEADEALSDSHSPYFTINFTNSGSQEEGELCEFADVVVSGIAVSRTIVPMKYSQHAASVDAYSTPWYLPSVSRSTGFAAGNGSLETPFSFPDSFGPSTGGTSSEILLIHSTSTSSSSSPTEVRKPLPRSASDSNFGAPALESVPAHPQLGKFSTFPTQRLHESAHERSKKSSETSIDVFEELEDGYKIPEMDPLHATNMASYLTEVSGKQQKQDDPHIQLVARDALQQRRLLYSNKIVLPGRHTGGRSVLCSRCKQMSPVLQNIPRRFTYAELELATNNFARDNFLAEGGFGFVYKGEQSGQFLAVKQHKLASTQGYKEFRSEVELLSCAQHRNLVMLLGYCDENGQQMLVYEFVCNKSLDWHLSPTKNPSSLVWSARLKIAIGAGRALRYLHEECRVGCIIHRDMRPNNILLTHDYEPMVGDFGLARSHPAGEEAIETQIIGTFGYLAPEYAESGQVSWKSDVYAFGVVLLELITGRKAIDLLRPPGQQSLTEWARPKLLNDAMLADLVDPRLENYCAAEVRAMMCSAYHCINKDPAARPRMSQVLHILESEARGFEEASRPSMDVYSGTASKSLTSQTSNIQQPAAASASNSLKNQIRKLQSGNSNSSSSGRKPKLRYGDML